jgi:hypothetical protein
MEQRVHDSRFHHAANCISRSCVNGIAVSAFNDVLGAIDSFDDWCRAWSERAAVHERLGEEALADRRLVSAGEHLSQAAVTHHFAKYLFVQNMGEMRNAHRKAVDCLTLALP